MVITAPAVHVAHIVRRIESGSPVVTNSSIMPAIVYSPFAAPPLQRRKSRSTCMNGAGSQLLAASDGNEDGALSLSRRIPDASPLKSNIIPIAEITIATIATEDVLVNGRESMALSCGFDSSRLPHQV